MKYEIPACEIVKMDITDIITASGDKVDGPSPIVPVVVPVG